MAPKVRVRPSHGRACGGLRTLGAQCRLPGDALLERPKLSRDTHTHTPALGAAAAFEAPTNVGPATWLTISAPQSPPKPPESPPKPPKAPWRGPAPHRFSPPEAPLSLKRPALQLLVIHAVRTVERLACGQRHGKFIALERHSALRSWWNCRPHCGKPTWFSPNRLHNERPGKCSGTGRPDPHPIDQNH